MVDRIRGSQGQKLRKRRLARTHGLCEMCNPENPTLATAVDHRTPLAHGGLDVDSNTRNLCKAHHDEVTAQQFGHATPRRQAVGVDGWPA